MKKRARIIDKTKKNIYPDSQALSPDSAIDDLSKPVSKETSKRMPTKITNNGFTVRKHSTKFTEDGMETETQEPLLLDGMNRRVKEDEIQGKCDECGEYTSQIFHCYVQGCKKTLCPRHVYYFEKDGKQIPYCLIDYNHVVHNFDTWQADAEQRRKKNEKQ